MLYQRRNAQYIMDTTVLIDLCTVIYCYMLLQLVSVLFMTMFILWLMGGIPPPPT